MCLQTKWKKPRITTKDKIVYKILEETSIPNEVNALHYPFTYQLGKIYKTDMSQTDDFTPFDDIAQMKCYLTVRTNLISIGQGFHSARTKKRLGSSSAFGYERYIYKCIIPKGSKYYIGLTDLIVSNKIKIIKKIT